MNHILQDPDRQSAEMFSWLWHNFMKRHTPKILAAFLFMAIQGTTLGLLSFMIRFVFDDVLGPGDGSKLLLVGGSVLFVFSLRGISGFIQRVLMMSVGARMHYDLQRVVMRHVFTLDPTFFDQNPPGELMARINDYTRAILDTWSRMLAPCVRDAVAVVSLFVTALLIDWQWTLLALAAVPVIGFPVVIIQKLLKRISNRAADIQAFIKVRLDEILHGIRTIKLYSAENHQFSRYQKATRDALSLSVRTEAAIAATPAMVDIIAGLGFLAVMLVAGSDVIEGRRTLGEFMSFFTAAVLLFDPVKRLGSLAGAWQVMSVNIGRVRTLLEAAPTIVDEAGAREVDPDHLTGGIEFRCVDFSFEDRQIIDDLSFSAAQCKTTALVGRSGVGKTTVFNLLTRMVDPDKGTITVGGTDLMDMTHAALRRLVSVVSQDAGIFDESIRDNILLGRMDAKEEEFQAAVTAARVDEFAIDLPDGYETRCGPRGSGLSGGQRQRIAIARALLKDSPILLLDEPTSALDAQSETLIQDAISTFRRNRTVLVIAHRLATIKGADLILVMDHGRIVDSGTHDELMSRPGLYRLLFTSQAGVGYRQAS